MVYNLNDALRNKIYSYSKLDFVYYFDSLTDEEKIHILKLIFLDFYKVSFYANNKRSDIFNQDIDNLINSIDDISLVVDLVKCAREFNSIDFVTKCILFEQIKKYDEELISINKSHVLDKLTYQVIDDLNSYKEYYFEYLCKHANKVVNTREIIDYFAYRIFLLKYNNKNHYERMILEMLKVYYKWKNYILEQSGKHLLCDEELVYLNKIKNDDLESIFDNIEKDFEFMKTIIGEYLHYTTANLETQERIVDQYFKENSSNELKNKLKIKEN